MTGFRGIVAALAHPLPEYGDPSLEGVTGRVLWGLGRSGVGVSDPAVVRAIAFLRDQQCESGAWWGRWKACYLAETATILLGLAAVGEPPGDVLGHGQVPGDEFVTQHDPARVVLVQGRELAEQRCQVLVAVLGPGSRRHTPPLCRLPLVRSMSTRYPPGTCSTRVVAVSVSVVSTRQPNEAVKPSAHDADDDLPARVPFGQIPDGVGRLDQRIRPVDQRLHLAGLDQLVHCPQVLRALLRRKPH